MGIFGEKMGFYAVFFACKCGGMLSSLKLKSKIGRTNVRILKTIVAGGSGLWGASMYNHGVVGCGGGLQVLAWSGVVVLDHELGNGWTVA